MIERKIIKVRTDMFEDTKFKLIDRMKERDLINYVWFRIMTLAGKVNKGGDLYFSSTKPYTIETFAIEFNREESEIELALGVLVDLEIVEVTENNLYRVKNFAKHQGIKTKESADKKLMRNKEEENENVIESKHNNREVKAEANTKTKDIDVFKTKNEVKPKKIVDIKKSTIIAAEEDKEDGIPIFVDIGHKRNRKNKKNKTIEIIGDIEEENIEKCGFIDDKDISSLGTPIMSWSF